MENSVLLFKPISAAKVNKNASQKKKNYFSLASDPSAWYTGISPSSLYHKSYTEASDKASKLFSATLCLRRLAKPTTIYTERGARLQAHTK